MLETNSLKYPKGSSTSDHKHQELRGHSGGSVATESKVVSGRKID